MRIDKLTNVPYTAPTKATQSAASGKAEAATGQAASSHDTFTLSAEAQALIEQNGAAMATSQAKGVSENSASEEETTFSSSTKELINLHLERRDKIYAYYSAQHEENMRFGDPRQHISDKYKNPNSPYFRSDMTQKEREIAWRQEICMLTGKSLQVRFDDYALGEDRNQTTITSLKMTANQNTRDQIEASIQELFAANGITIPEGVSFRLSVDPYDHYIRALGLEDAALAQRIEEALNRGYNGRNLYYHIDACNPEQLGFGASEQYGKVNTMQSSLFHMVKDLTGQDIRFLTRNGNTFMMPDGQDLWDVLTERASKLQNNDGSKGYDISGYRGIYEQLARDGWQSGNGLSLEYRDGSLYDIGTEYGYGPGQTDWQDWVRENPKEAAAQMMKWVDKQAIQL